jgi:hypothetical protein
VNFIQFFSSLPKIATDKIRCALAFAPVARHICGMNGKLLNRFEAPAYAYREIETALAAALGIRAQHQRGALRARLKHVQRLGLVDLKAGKGKRIEYSYAQATQWLLALILAETGVDPTMVVATIKNNWKHISRDIEEASSYEARSGGFALYLWLKPHAMSAAWEEKAPIAMSVMRLDASQPRPLAPMPHDHPLVQMIHASPDDWSCFYNLTRALSRLETALPRRG